MEENKNVNGFKEFYIKHKKKFNFAYMIIICLVIAKLLTSFVFVSVMVDGNSMYSTLKNGDKGITDGLFYKMFGIDRFDIVIVDYKEEKLVKRVVGLPGETIEYKDSVLYVNDKKIEEPFLMPGMKTELTYNKNFKVTLGENEYYVLGDNRTNSMDSRYFGAIKKSQIEGVGIMLFASCDSVSDSGSCKGLSLRWPKFVK